MTHISILDCIVILSTQEVTRRLFQNAKDLDVQLIFREVFKELVLK